MASRSLRIDADSINVHMFAVGYLLGAANRTTEVRHICRTDNGKTLCAKHMKFIYRGPTALSYPICMKCLNKWENEYWKNRDAFTTVYKVTS